MFLFALGRRTVDCNSVSIFLSLVLEKSVTSFGLVFLLSPLESYESLTMEFCLSPVEVGTLFCFGNFYFRELLQSVLELTIAASKFSFEKNLDDCGSARDRLISLNFFWTGEPATS